MTFLFAGLLLVAAVAAALMTFAFWTTRRIEATIPPPGRFITVDGVRLHYIDEGSGPVLLMIHGLASQLQTFTFALSGHLPGFRRIILDRPGNGYSQAASSAGFAAQAHLVAAFLRALEVDKALIVGHSLGGAVSLALAIEHPECVAGLALISPATQNQETPPEALSGLAIRSDLLRWMIGWTLAIPSAMRAGPKTMAALFGPDPVPDDFGTRGGGLLPLRPSAFRNASRDLESASRDLDVYPLRYKEIEKPIGVLFGTADRILDHRLHGETLRSQIVGLDLQYIENAGHMVPLSAPERTAAFIEQMAARSGFAQPAPV